MGHVTHGIQGDECAHPGNHQQHDDCERVCEKGNFDVEAAARDPLVKHSLVMVRSRALNP